MYVKSDRGRVWHVIDSELEVTACGLNVEDWHSTNIVSEDFKFCKKCKFVLDEIALDYKEEPVSAKADKKKNQHSF